MKADRHLTERERQVLKLLVDGYDNKDVGKVLGLSVRTVEAHRARVMLKLQIHDLAALVKYALINKITSLDEHRSS